MKKILITLGIVIVLVIGTFGSVAMAKNELNPPDAWNYIVEKVDEIINILTDSDSGLVAIDNKIAALSDNDSSTMRFMSDQGIVNETYVISDEFVYTSPTFDEGAHFHVTVWITGDVDTGDHVKIHHHYYSQDMSSTSSSAFIADEVEFYTYEFDAAKCAIAYTNYDDTKPLDVTWAVTITYSSASMGE